MALYKIEWKASAKKELRKIDKQEISKILEEVEKLAFNPFPPNYKKLIGTEHTFRIRIGNYRVVYLLENEKLIIEITRVRHRKDVYTGLWLLFYSNKNITPKIQTGALKNVASVKSRFCAAHEIYGVFANVIPLEKFQNAIAGVCITIGDDGNEGNLINVECWVG